MKSPVPDLIHGLRCLTAILAKAEAHCESQEIDPDALLKGRLFPDMFDLTRNVIAACDAAKFTAARLSRAEPPQHDDSEATFAELQARIVRTIAFLETIPDAAFENAETSELVVPLAPEGTAPNGLNYLTRFALPHFYLHLATAYNILRHNGVVLGKRDFLWAS